MSEYDGVWTLVRAVKECLVQCRYKIEGAAVVFAHKIRLSWLNRKRITECNSKTVLQHKEIKILYGFVK